MSDVRWTAEQAAAITAEGNVLLAASAGTGKTTTVVGKILWLLGIAVGERRDTGDPIPGCHPDRRCSLGQIAAITFTEKAAYDLKKKLRSVIDESGLAEEYRWEVDRASIGTIHGFCMELLREHALRFGIDPSFRVMDERATRVEQENIIREVLFEALEKGDPGAVSVVSRRGLAGYEYAEGTVGQIREVLRDLRWHDERYSAWEKDGRMDEQAVRRLHSRFAEEKDGPVVDECAALYQLARRAERLWQDHMAAENVRDFDSLILDTRRILTGPDARAALQSVRRRYRVLIIDEFQDTDGAQRDIAFAIAGLRDTGSDGADAPTPQLYLVGDPKQSIYRFRGADISVWNSVKAEVCGDEPPLELTHNFRSQPEVIRFANDVARQTLARVALDLGNDLAEGRVEYTDLTAANDASGTGGVEWMAADAGSAEERRRTEAELVATRIHELVEGADVLDPVSRKRQRCRYGDIALLYRARTGRDHYEKALRRYGIPYYITNPGGFDKRQEVLDLLTLLRLVDNPRDDLRAFAFLRSPFVGLRDEVIARIRLQGGSGSLLEQARRFLEQGEWFAAPEHPALASIEKAALAAGIEAVHAASELCWREPLDELVDDVIERTGYRLHLMLLEDHRELLANVERFLRILEDYRDSSLGSFLEIWDRWDHRDAGIAQAPLHSKEDDVVTISSIHSAKGLEWPVVFLIDTGNTREIPLSGDYWSDPRLGPILCPKDGERGPWAEEIHRRSWREGNAERARLLYVAMTRPRDRLIICGPLDDSRSLAGWLAAGRTEEVRVRTMAPQLEMPMHRPVVELGWLDEVEEGEYPPLVAPLEAPPNRFVTSASELMTRDRRPTEWELRYGHGVEPSQWFAPRLQDGGRLRLPPRERGTLIHGVLERIQDEDELASLLEAAVSAMDVPDMEALLAPGTRYREALEEEIRGVVRSEEWKWYVDGEHYRELRFIHLAGRREWRIGAFDLFRPARDAARPQMAFDFSGMTGAESTDSDTWIIDFKTHQIAAEQVEASARDYEIQARVYREAVGAMGGSARVALHFTHPNKAIEM